MRIGLNLVDYSPGAMGGVEIYAKNLVRYLQVVDHRNEYILLCNKMNSSRLPCNSASFSCREIGFARPSFGWFMRGCAEKMTGYDILRPVIDRLDIDLIHHPFNYLNPAGCRVPAVVTFVDIQQEYHPEFFTEQVLRWRRVHYRRASREASRIIAISDHVKRTIVERYDVSTEMIDVIHLGHGSEFRPIEDSASLETVRRKYRLDRPFMYYPAGTWPHKNHKRLLAAVKLLKERRLFDGMLVLTGIKMQAHREVISEIERLGLKRDVVVLGYLPESELPCLYNLARVLVFPSLFEGFGIPLVEAMASGCPVVCADVTSIPEIVGDAGVYFDPLSVEMIADRVWAVWSDDVMRTAMVRRGLERAKLFDWEQTARKTVASYSRALGV